MLRKVEIYKCNSMKTPLVEEDHVIRSKAPEFMLLKKVKLGFNFESFNIGVHKLDSSSTSDPCCGLKLDFGLTAGPKRKKM